MDQFVLEGLQHLKLTKEEEEDIALSTRSRSNLLEECAFSLFDKLLLNRQQNQKAIKSTLRTTWKMGSELRIVDVGKDILQFKFTSEYQMEWVERNGPWNFYNNIPLLCRWKKGLSVSNISFTHSPFWVQVWGLPFENLSEEVGKDLVPEKWGKSEGSSTKVEKNPKNRFEVESSDLGAQLSNLPHKLHVEMDSGKGPYKAYSLAGFPNSSVNEAHEITSPLKL
nr:hypothetical protein CFP56_62209 [Quercus suber]